MEHNGMTWKQFNTKDRITIVSLTIFTLQRSPQLPDPPVTNVMQDFSEPFSSTEQPGYRLLR